MRVLYAKVAERPLLFVLLVTFMHAACAAAYADNRPASVYACGAQHAPGAVSGRMSLPSNTHSASVYVFESSQMANTYIDSLVSSLNAVELFGQYAHALQSPAAPGATSGMMNAGGQMMKHMSELSKVSLKDLRVHAAPLHENGKFSCTGLQPGTYELLLEVRRTVAPPSYIKGLSGPIPQKVYYEARRVVIPKPSKPKTRSVVNISHFRLIGKSPPDLF